MWRPFSAIFTSWRQKPPGAPNTPTKKEVDLPITKPWDVNLPPVPSVSPTVGPGVTRRPAPSAAPGRALKQRPVTTILTGWNEPKASGKATSAMIENANASSAASRYDKESGHRPAYPNVPLRRPKPIERPLTPVPGKAPAVTLFSGVAERKANDAANHRVSRVEGVAPKRLPESRMTGPPKPPRTMHLVKTGQAATTEDPMEVTLRRPKRPVTTIVTGWDKQTARHDTSRTRKDGDTHNPSSRIPRPISLLPNVPYAQLPPEVRRRLGEQARLLLEADKDAGDHQPKEKPKTSPPKKRTSPSKDEVFVDKTLPKAAGPSGLARRSRDMSNIMPQGKTTEPRKAPKAAPTVSKRCLPLGEAVRAHEQTAVERRRWEAYLTLELSRILCSLRSYLLATRLCISLEQGVYVNSAFRV